MPVTLPTLLLFAATAAAAPRPAQLGLCASCHGEDGCRGQREIPRLAGQNPEYLGAALAAYREGTRDHAAMHAIAGALAPRDVDAFAQWYAKQPACPAP
jgi:cytochrome c553